MMRPILKRFDSSNKIKRIWTEFFSLSQSHQSSVKLFRRIVKQKRGGEKALRCANMRFNSGIYIHLVGVACANLYKRFGW